eukprot:COSAG04_NODE_31118_length_258_cov_1.220126_2_plen_20_part_01
MLRFRPFLLSRTTQPLVFSS